MSATDNTASEHKPGASLLLSSATTVAEAVARLQSAFQNAGLENPGRDARLLVQEILGFESGGHILKGAQRLAEHAELLIAAARRRLAREPVSRICGHRGFYGRKFRVSSATLDPRPDTETLIDAAMALLAEDEMLTKPLRILDLGTGTGCILVTLLAELPAATGTGTDISAGALDVASKNARRHGVAGRAKWAMARSAAPEPESYDLMVSNPPYIPTACISDLDPEVRLYDPVGALDGGPNGLHIYLEILTNFKPETIAGWSIFEVGHDQADAVRNLVIQHAKDHGHARPPDIRTFPDLNGHTRCVAWKTRL